MFYPSYNAALAKLPYQEISKPLKLTTRLSDEVYTSPLDGMFATKAWADAIKVGDQIIGSGLTRSLPYRAMMLIPKGISQLVKLSWSIYTLKKFFSAYYNSAWW